MAVHRRRLLQMWRSAGWPCCDAIEIDLLAAGLLARRLDDQGRDTLRVTDDGIQWLATTRRRHQAAFDVHEALVAQVARQMQQAGRVVWRGLRLRAPLGPTVHSSSGPDFGSYSAATNEAAPGLPLPWPGHAVGTPVPAATRWVIAMPDVYSIRHTTVEAYAEPVAHEIKVRRADLLADLRRPDKGAAYRALASQCWYVLARGIADVDEVPAAYGVMLADADRLEVVRPAPRRPMRLPFGVWMSLARADAMRPPGTDAQEPAAGDQRWLGDSGMDLPGV